MPEHIITITATVLDALEPVPAAAGSSFAAVGPTLQAAAALAQEAKALEELIPGDVNPIVLPRELLAPLAAAADAFLSEAEPLLEVRELDPAPDLPTSGPLAEERAANAQERRA